jgi:MOSC domain-containing protein YiiM/ferredoxin-NADP reductase
VRVLDADKSLGDCSSHYSQWKTSYPDSAEKFVPGGFGENFVTAHMSERNVCIGDVIAVGAEVLLQVSLPRQPCFKLNHRFSIKKFAPETYKLSRTGWYYRVLREGTVRVGDELRLVERKWPDWTIERIQEYLHRVTDNAAMNEQIAEIEALGAEAKNQFKRRVAKANAGPQQAKGKKESWTDYRIIEHRMETPRILSLALEPVDPDLRLKTEYVGSFARIKLPNGLTRTYSLVSGGDADFIVGRKLVLGIALDEKGRGGSRYLHESAKVGDIIPVGNITTSTNAVGSASNHIFIVGGIGITAFLGLAEAYNGINWNVEMHYAIRSLEDLPYSDRIKALGGRVTLYNKEKGERMDIRKIVKERSWNSQLYVCGPDRMMNAAQEAVKEFGVPDGEVHFEAFGADVSGDPFEVEVVNRPGKILTVKEDETLLDVLRREFDEIPSSCEVGNCGTCKVDLKSGQVDHRGSALSEEEKPSAMLACVSRGVGRIAIEI